MGTRSIVLAGDEGYARPMAVVVASVVATTSLPAELLILGADLSDESRARISAAARHWPVRFETFHPEWLDELPVHRSLSRLPLAAFARIFVSRLVADDCERILYLDGDVLVRQSVQPLLDMSLEGCIVAAVGDDLATHFANPSASRNIPGWREAGIAPSALVFNSGVLVIDRERWDAGSVQHRTLEAVERTLGSTSWADQAALNLTLWRDWLPLETRWNTRDLDAAIAHFSGPYKPWQGPRLANRLYVEYLDRAASIGWAIPGRRMLERRTRLHEAARAALPPIVSERRRRQ
jgi:lipopolysaccharide biosynthesis glycosyltransferase